MTKSLSLKSLISLDVLETFQDKSNSLLSIKISYEKMRLLCRYPVWNMIREFIQSTHSYQEGLALSVSLIATAEQHSEKMTKSENELYRDRFLEFHLDMLDKLDMWADYLVRFKKLRSNFEFCHKWKRTSGISWHPHISHYICREETDCVFVHFLISRHERKEIIERKLQRRKAGKSTAHLLHHSRSELSADELRQRIEFLVKKFTPYMPLC